MRKTKRDKRQEKLGFRGNSLRSLLGNAAEIQATAAPVTQYYFYNSILKEN